MAVFRTTILVFLLVAQLPFNVNAKESGATLTRIAVISSYHSSYSWSQGTNEGLLAGLLEFGYLDSSDQRETFTSTDHVVSSKADLRKFWMDTKRKSSEAQIAETVDVLVGQLEEFKPDLVMLGDDNAANYMGNYYLDSETPVVFWGVNTATREISADSKHKELPIIAMTANVMSRDRDKAINSGMNDHIAKPIHPDTMFMTMAKWIKPGITVEASRITGVQTNEPEQQTGLPELPGINKSLGLKATMNKEDLYKRLLLKFRDKNQDFQKEFIDALVKDLDTATRVAHTLKGTAANLGMEELQKAALQLETACRDHVDEISTHLGLVIERLNVVLESLKKV